MSLYRDRKELEEAISDYCILWPTPYALSDNLRLASAFAAEVYNFQRGPMLIAGLHNGFEVGVSGHMKSLDVLKDLLIPIKRVRSIRIYDGTDYTVRMNYTELRLARK